MNNLFDEFDPRREIFLGLIFFTLLAISIILIMNAGGGVK